jgi:hypothetical protein
MDTEVGRCIVMGGVVNCTGKRTWKNGYVYVLECYHVEALQRNCRVDKLLGEVHDAMMVRLRPGRE